MKNSKIPRILPSLYFALFLFLAGHGPFQSQAQAQISNPAGTQIYLSLLKDHFTNRYRGHPSELIFQEEDWENGRVPQVTLAYQAITVLRPYVDRGIGAIMELQQNSMAPYLGLLRKFGYSLPVIEPGFLCEDWENREANAALLPLKVMAGLLAVRVGREIQDHQKMLEEYLKRALEAKNLQDLRKKNQ